MLETRALSHSFGSLQVLRDINLSFRPGEVVALIGGNGAGKSTLLRLLGGAMRPSSGSVFAGDGISAAGSIAAARKAGIWMADQEGALIPLWTVADHFRILAELDHGKPWQGLAPDVDGNETVESLPQHQRQLVEIALVCSGARYAALFDEPTAGQSLPTRAVIHRAMRSTAEAGASVVWVTHDLSAALAHANRIVVLKDGVVALDSPTVTLSRETLVALLVKDAATLPRAREQTSRHLGEPVLQLVASAGGAPIFIRRGEIVGIALGARRSSRDILRFAAGLSRTRQAPWIEAVTAGLDIKYLSRERDREWDFPGQSLQFCLAASSWRELGKLGWIATDAERALASDLQQRFAIVAASVDVPIETLSGGNRQKALLARLCARSPDGLLLDEPFSGVDAPTRLQIQTELWRISSETGIVLVSQEWEDMVMISDRVLVLQDNEGLRELRKEELTPEAIEHCLLEGYESAMEVSG
jgi:ribose transport system ATP-binding protein